MNIDVNKEYQRIRETLQKQQRTAEALQWCSDNRSHLKKSKNQLEFLLRRQDLLNLLLDSSGKKGAAVLYAKKHFTALAADSSLLPNIQQALALLVVPKKSEHIPYRTLFQNENRWNELAETFTEAYFSLYGLPKKSPLLTLYQLGAAAFKTSACDQQETKVLECPACQDELRPLMQNLPLAHFEYSRLYCRISKRLMAEDNPPYCLPNGQIYSYQALQEMAKKKNEEKGENGWVTCPVTQAIFRLENCKKCFVL